MIIYSMTKIIVINYSRNHGYFTVNTNFKFLQICKLQMSALYADYILLVQCLHLYYMSVQYLWSFGVNDIAKKKEENEEESEEFKPHFILWKYVMD